MLYLDYAKQIGNRYILNLFADSVEDIDEIVNDYRNYPAFCGLYITDEPTSDYYYSNHSNR